MQTSNDVSCYLNSSLRPSLPPLREVCTDFTPFRTYAVAKERSQGCSRASGQPSTESLVGLPILMLAPYETRAILNLKPGNCSLPNSLKTCDDPPSTISQGHPDTKEHVHRRPWGRKVGHAGATGSDTRRTLRPFLLPSTTAAREEAALSHHHPSQHPGFLKVSQGTHRTGMHLWDLWASTKPLTEPPPPPLGPPPTLRS